MVMVHVGTAPEQSPPHAVKLLHDCGVAEIVTTVPCSNELLLVSWPFTVFLTLPAPVPGYVIASEYVLMAKLALTVFALSIVIVQVELVE